MISSTAIKFIGEKEMVIPITAKGFLLSHKDYVNYYHPTIIEIIDGEGRCFRYKEASVLEGIQWVKSIQKLSVLHRVKPEYLEVPFLYDLQMLKDKVHFFIQKNGRRKGLDKEEEKELIEKIKDCQSHREVILELMKVSYWR
ncbi:MAG: hypothetical protein AAF806_09510 [Bacteroidota bacterium]